MLLTNNSPEKESPVIPCSFRGALGQAGSCCEVSGTGMQRDAGSKSNSRGLQQNCANKHCQILQFPQRTRKIFQRPSFQDRAYCHRWFRRQKACSNSNRQVSSFQEGGSSVSAASGAAPPCSNSRKAAPLTGSTTATTSQRGTLRTCFLFWSFLSI